MNRILTPALAAAALLTVAPSATAGDPGRTVCVLRNRPVAIHPQPRVRVAVNPYYSYSGGSYSGGNYQGSYPGYPAVPYYRVPVVYGNVNPRLHYVNPCLPNGYVGGIQNLPTNVVQIPPSFTRVPTMHRPAGRPAAPPPPVATPAPVRSAR